MLKKTYNTKLIFVGLALATAATSVPIHAQTRTAILEEVIVTAQKREETLQDAPIAISALNEAALEQRGITGLGDLMAGAIPTLKIAPFPNNPATLIISMRGVGVANAGQITRDGGVGIYVDGVYMGRAQGLGIDMVDLARIEVLRGPQGTLYGRNTIGGAVNMVPQKPTGEFGLKQTFDYSSDYDQFKSITHVNLPSMGGVNSKFSYLTSEHDGYVENPSSGRSHRDNYNAFDKQGFRIALNWEVSDSIVVDYTYDQSESDVTQNYFQLKSTGRLTTYSGDSGLIPSFADIGAFIGNAGTGAYLANLRPFPKDPKGFNDTARASYHLRPNVVEAEGHALHVAWDINENLTLKSITSFREMDQEGGANYGGVFGIGLASGEDGTTIDQEQFSQEFQFIGSAMDGKLEYVGGLYYYSEDVEEDSKVTHVGVQLAMTPLAVSFNPAVLFAPGGIAPFPVTIGGKLVTLDHPVPLANNARFSQSEVESWAVYGQARYQVNDQLGVTVGLRYTNDEKEMSREALAYGLQEVSVSDSNVDPMITLDYDWSDGLNTYLRWASAYKAGGVSISSNTFGKFDKEIAETIELGLKSTFWESRARLNVAVFSTVYEDMQLDFSDPTNIRVTETFNTSNGDVDIAGAELEFTIIPIDGLTLGIDYTYLDWKLGLQPNPLSTTGAFEEFHRPQAPRHSGTISMDYVFEPMSIGTLAFHADVISTGEFYYSPLNNYRHDSRDLLNARLTLSDIPIGNDNGSFKLAVWGKNLTDEEYVVYSITDAGTGSISDAYGEPRTVGISLSYEY